MGRITSAETVLKNAVKRTAATIKKKQPQRAPTFKAWTVAKLLETYKDPRAILLEIAGKDTKALAAEMQCSLQDALAERRLCAQAVIPYICQKLPVQIDMKSTRTINLNLVTEQQYQDLVEVAAEPDSDDGSFSMQLLATAQPGDTQASEHKAETPAAQSVVTERADQRTPVTPSVERLAPESEFWNQLDDGRRQRLEDRPAGDEPDRWQRTNSGTFGPGRPK